MSNHWMHAATHAIKAKGDDSRGAGVVLLIVGFFLAPIGIGIPLMIIGAIKLFK